MDGSEAQYLNSPDSLTAEYHCYFTRKCNNCKRMLVLIGYYDYRGNRHLHYVPGSCNCKVSQVLVVKLGREDD